MTRFRFARWLTLVLVLLTVFALAGCPGPEEKKDLGDRMENAADEVGDAMDKAGDKMEQAADDMKDAAEEAGDQIEEGAEAVKKKVEGDK